MLAFTPLLFLFGYAAGCILALARHPIFGLVTYVAMFYLHPESRWWGEALPHFRWDFVAAIVTFISVHAHKKNLGNNGRFFSHGIVVVLLMFIGWLALQLVWALEYDEQLQLLELYIKYLILMWLIYRCVDSEKNLRIFLWAHVIGCFVLGWIAYTEYTGGRFEGFGGADIGEANAGALQIATGIITASALFLYGRRLEKLVLFGLMPFIVNGLIVSISRGAFLSLAAGGLAFNKFTPKQYKKRVRVLSLLAVALFFMLTNPDYWTRIQTIQYLGEHVQDVDTGTGRLVLMKAQWKMFKAHPFGCGHRCTATLSPLYLKAKYLAHDVYGKATNARSSHNTFMTMLVEHGVVGVAVYLAILWWTIRNVTALASAWRDRSDFLAVMVPVVAAVMVTVFLGDMFVDYLKMEVRFWFVAITMIMLDLQAKKAWGLERTNKNHGSGAPPARTAKAMEKPGLARRQIVRRRQVSPPG